MQPTQISCPNCLTTNRLPYQRLADKPKCGKCQSALFVAKPMALSAANVVTILNNNDIPVLVDCWAPWCGPCRNFAPIFETAAAKFEPTIRLAKLNTEQHQGVASRWRISSIPTLILFRHAKEVARVSGALSLTQLETWLQQNKALTN